MIKQGELWHTLFKIKVLVKIFSLKQTNNIHEDQLLHLLLDLVKNVLNIGDRGKDEKRQDLTNHGRVNMLVLGYNVYKKFSFSLKKNSFALFGGTL